MGFVVILEYADAYRYKYEYVYSQINLELTINPSKAKEGCRYH